MDISMINKILVPFICGLLISCTTTPTPIPVTQQEIDTAKAEYLQCLQPYAAKYDDGISDAKTIATALIGACTQEYEKTQDLVCKTCNPQVKLMLDKKRSEIQLELATRAVLANRHHQ